MTAAPAASASVIGTDLVVSYGAHVAIDRSTFTLPRGGVIALIGPNGSGKSTLLSAIAGLVEVTSGELEVPLSARPRTGISYVLQTTKVNDALPITVREVVTMGRYARVRSYGRLRSEDREAVAVAMERTGVTDLAERHLSELSGGQRQRVFVAQGIAQDHELLLLDEPLTGLDLPSARAIDEVIHDERSRGCTIIISTHDLSEARVADHVVLMSGRVVANGTPEEVLTAPLLAEAYGQSLLHVEEGAVFLDDPAHLPVAGRHIHHERTISPEGQGAD